MRAREYRVAHERSDETQPHEQGEADVTERHGPAEATEDESTGGSAGEVQQQDTSDELRHRRIARTCPSLV